MSVERPLLVDSQDSAALVHAEHVVTPLTHGAYEVLNSSAEPDGAYPRDFLRFPPTAGAIGRTVAIPLLDVRRGLDAGPALRQPPGDLRARLSDGEEPERAPTPNDLRAALSRDYPRLDIRLGRTYAHPWETRDAAPVHGWIDENGDIIPFDS